MNIFAVNSDPKIAARELCNKHIIKMPTETGQLLYLCFSNNKNNYYKHPAAVWTRNSLSNFEWLVEHGKELCLEYQRRYKRIHRASLVINWAARNKDKLVFQDNGLTEFARCFGKYKSVLAPVLDTIQAYKNYYLLDKKEFAKWPSIESVPNWWLKEREKYVDKSFKNAVYLYR